MEITNTILKEFEKAFEAQFNFPLSLMPKETETAILWAAKWIAKKCEDACMSPTSKGRIHQLMQGFCKQKTRTCRTCEGLGRIDYPPILCPKCGND